MDGAGRDPAGAPDLFDLVARRKACRICVARDPGRIRSAADYPFDPDVVSHWAQWLGHPRPRLLIVGQDFGDVGYFERHRGADGDCATNRNLHALLRLAGFAPGPPPGPDRATPVHLSNAILCLKEAPMARPISGRWVRTCAEHHLRPLVARLAPEMVVGMGANGWRAVRVATGFADGPAAVRDAAGGIWPRDGRLIAAVGHCGPLGLANRAWARQRDDWRRIGAALGAPGGRADRA